MSLARFPGIKTKIDDNVVISRAKIEKILIIFLQLGFQMENLSLKNFFMNVLRLDDFMFRYDEVFF